MPALTSALADLRSAALRCVETARADSPNAVDDALLEHQRELAAAARLIEVAAGTIAAEIDHRSRPELGYAGLAQSRGARTPEALVQTVSGVSSSTARRLVRVGTLVAATLAHDADASAPSPDAWLAEATRAAAAGRISGEALDAIRAGLGRPNDDVTAQALTAAALELLNEASIITLERLHARARELRDDLDASGVATREEHLRDQRSLRLFPQSSGMTRITGLLDPESAAVLSGAIDAATSPRRGGPRFVDPDDRAHAEQVINDARSIEQIALDALVELVEIALGARAATAPGARQAEVRVLVTLSDLDRRAGSGYLEGQTASVSIPTAERHMCIGSLVPILFDTDGSALNLGRTQRLHNARQRTVIATRDGGCLIADCDRPPGWCEVHHINEFGRGGQTDLADGVLLCRHHHMMVHNNGWRIERRGGSYWLIPPPEIDPDQTPIALSGKSPAMRHLLATV